MTCSRDFRRLLQTGCLGLIGTLAVAAGCGGSETPGKKYDAGPEVGGTGGTGAALNVTPNSVNLGTLSVNGSGMQTVLVTNTGKTASGNITVTPTAGITATGCSTGLQPGTSCTLTIVVSPTNVGAFSGQVSIAASPGAVTPLVVSVIANVSPQGMFTVTPGSIPLGNIAVGVAAPKQTITVTAAVAITDLIYATNGPDVSIDKAASTCTATLAKGASCTIAVNFLATTAGLKDEGVVISGGGAAGQTSTVSITANAQNPPRLAISPSAPQTLATTAGTPSSPITFQVQNTGDVQTGTISATLTGANAASFSVTSNCLVLATLASCNVSVVYKPAAAAKAAETATLVVTDTAAGGSTVQVVLNGTPFGPSDLAITSTTTDLGQVLVGTTGAATVFTVTNKGDSTSGVMTATVSSNEFLITNDTCTGATLAKGAACTVSVALKPGTQGGKSASLQVAAVGMANAAVLTITGTGVTNVLLTASPTSVDFASVRVNKTGTAATVTIKNAGGTASGPLTITRSGNFAVFPMTNNGCSAALPPNGTCTFTVNFAPTEARSELAGYTVTDGTASATVSLSGTGLPEAGISISPSPVSACAEPLLTGPTALATSSICFATAVVGGTSPTIVFTVTASDPLPSGLTDTGALVVGTNPATPTDFTVVRNGCTTPLLAGATCQIQVAFTPTAAGLRQAALNVTSANGGSDSATMQGTGLSVIEVRPMDTVDPSDATKKISGLDFGQVPLLGDTNETHEYMVIVRGPSTETNFTTQVLTTLTDPSQPADFSYAPALTNPCNTASNGAVTLDFKAGSHSGGAWAEGAARLDTNGDGSVTSADRVYAFVCTFDVRFYPQSSKGAKTATLTATGTGPVSDSKTLTGTATGVLTFDANIVEFPTLQVGESSNTQATATVVSLSPSDEIVTLKNHSTTADLGPATLTMGGPNAAEFIIVRDFCTAATLNHGGGECEVGVAFVPTSAGQKTAILTANIGAETASVTFTGGATDPFDITITPDQYVFATNNYHDFGTVAQGSPSTWHAFTITNPAGSPRSAQVTYGLASDAAPSVNTGLTLANGNNHDFGSCGNTGTTTLAPGTSCTVWVQFRPLATDAAGTTLNNGAIQATDQAKGKTVQVKAKGKVGSVVSIAPASYTFPDTAGGLTSPATTLTVTNNGNAQITLDLPANTALAPFSIDQATGCAVGAHTLAAGATCPLVVTFIGRSGTTVSTVDEVDLVVGASGYSGASGTTELKGTSVMPAKLEAVGFDNRASATPFYQTINLGGVRVGYSSADVTLTFKNVGSAPTSSLSYAWQGVAAGNPDSEFIIVNEATEGCVGRTSLAAGASCKITVHFTPSSTAAAGLREKTFALSATTGGVVQVFTFQGYALNPSASAWIGISGGALGFFTFSGSTPSGVGASFPRQVFQLTNGTATSITNLALTPSGDTTSFTLITSGDDAGSAPCGATLNASSSCTFGVGFTPTAWDPYAAYRHATITANIGTGVQLGVFGQVRSPARLSITPVVADPSPYAFGEVVLGTNPSKAFTVTNLGETASTALVIATTTTGPTGASSQFGHAGGCEGATLAAGASCVGSLTFTPGTIAANNWAGTLSATVTGSSVSVDLSAASVHNTLLAVNVAALTFPATSVGKASDTQVVTLSNAAGSQTSGLLTISLADATNFSIVSTGDCPLASDPNAATLVGLGATNPECIVTVAFTPRTLGTGTFTTTLTMTASPGNAQPVTLSGTAVSALKTDPATSINNATSTSLTSPISVRVYLEAGAPDTGMLTTSVSGGNYKIIEDQCVATKLAGGDSCLIKLVFLGTAATPNKQGTLTINGGSGGATASVVLNSSTPPTQ